MSNKTILVVDDDRAMTKYLSLALKKFALISKLDISVLTENNPEIAFERFNCIQPILLISDLEMPQMTGLELEKKIHALNPKIPIYLMSGSHFSAHKAKTFGFKGFLRKPFNGEILRRIMQKHC